MKIILFIISAMIICSCSNSGTRVEDAIKSETGRAIYVDSFTYKNHSYYVFRSGKANGVVHAPQCSYCLSLFD